ncbi:hypothetical protein KTH44_16110 [Acinetobacter bereziniae]|uniref:hypothetical protein n=1 Tax=Acinetobacter bereziniae TaxID=106648 RepID=UPI0021CD82D3|nr:hypothetical protein [Acinetobacter bereziniae]MCU4320642.1 hypothetical protein [Acinetobacter bereziniae]
MDGIQAVQAVKAGKKVQYREDENELWEPFDITTGFRVGCLLGEPNQRGKVIQFRIEPLFINFNGTKVPAPLSEEPKIDQNYWFYNPKKTNGIATGRWEASCEDLAIFTNIGIYLEEDEVVQVRDAYRAFMASERITEDD